MNNYRFTMVLGLESCSDFALTSVSKGYTYEQIKSAFDNTYQNLSRDQALVVNTIVDLPHQNVEDIKQNYDRLLTIRNLLSEFRKVEIDDFETILDFSIKLKKTLEKIDDIILINKRWLSSDEEIKIPIENGYKIIEPLKEEEKNFVENLIKQQETTKGKFLLFEEKIEEKIDKIRREKAVLIVNEKIEKTNKLF
jgi:hypothetical protein